MLEFGICRLQRAGAAIAAVVLAAGCSNYGGTSTALPAGNAARAQSLVSAADGGDSILKRLKKQVVIGSTVDPKNGAGNPYGLTVAPVSDGDFTKGDLVVCNFNDKANVQGTGRSIIALHNKPGSKPIERFVDQVAQGLRCPGARRQRHDLGRLDGRQRQSGHRHDGRTDPEHQG